MNLKYIFYSILAVIILGLGSFGWYQWKQSIKYAQNKIINDINIKSTEKNLNTQQSITSFYANAVNQNNNIEKIKFTKFVADKITIKDYNRIINCHLKNFNNITEICK